jgi:hypothetical protein
LREGFKPLGAAIWTVLMYAAFAVTMVGCFSVIISSLYEGG